MDKVKLVTITPEAEKLIAYCARVSSPQNQANSVASKLLSYCIRNKHWSIFEQASMTVEINTSLAIATQILRHKSFKFQQFSQRYAEADLGFEDVRARRQDTKNRQNSIDDISDEDQQWFQNSLEEVKNLSVTKYKEALSKGVAKECARFLLPQFTSTRLYMTGDIRSFIHYVEVRTDPSTQLEHRLVAEGVKQLLIQQCPTIAQALGWTSQQT